MRKVSLALCLLSTAAFAAPVLTPTRVVPPAPTALSIIGCRVDVYVNIDTTDGLKRVNIKDVKSTDTIIPPFVHNYRDEEWHRDAEFKMECQREELQLTEKDLDSPAAKAGLIPLHPNFADKSQCAMRSAEQAVVWRDRHPGWDVAAAGCPTPIMNDNGTPDDKSDDYQVGWKLPECPVFEPGSQADGKPGVRMYCTFSNNEI